LLDLQVNASASFRRGFLSLFSRDLTLTIGLPLVAGLTVRQLGGVLAHEFGHFAQGAGMRLTFVVRSVNAWFAGSFTSATHGTIACAISRAGSTSVLR
jgi:Zn-dependent protease with chaperone function